jgi:hypothetical protein
VIVVKHARNTVLPSCVTSPVNRHRVHDDKDASMSDGNLLEVRVRLTRLASELAIARSERDLARIADEVARVRSSLDVLLADLVAA